MESEASESEEEKDEDSKLKDPDFMERESESSVSRLKEIFKLLKLEDPVYCMTKNVNEISASRLCSIKNTYKVNSSNFFSTLYCFVVEY